MQVVHGRGYVYAMEYHIVWCTKYRRKVLTDKVISILSRELEKYAQENGFTIEEKEIMPDHIHLLISASPQVFIPDIMKGMKGVSARMVFKACPELKDKLWKGHLWNPSYFVATISENTEEQIRHYINSQKER